MSPRSVQRPLPLPPQSTAALHSSRRQFLLVLLAGGALGLGVATFTPETIAVELVLLALGLAILFRPELGVLFFIAAANILPFAVIPLRFVFSFTLVDFLLTCLLAVWLLRAILQDQPLFVGPVGALILVYLGLALVSFLLGLAYSISPERMRLFAKSINSTLLFLGVLNCVRAESSLRRATLGLMIGGGFAGCIALAILFLPEVIAIQLLSALGPLGYPTGPEALRPIADTNILRAIGTSIDPNVLGGLLMMASALLVGQLFAGSPLLGRRWIWILASCTSAALLLTQSRGAMGGFVVGLLVIGWLRNRRLCVAIAGLALAALFLGDAIVAVLPQTEVFLGRIQSGLSFQDRAAAMRLDEYANALDTISRYPWFGIGFGETPSIDLFLGVSSIYLLVGQEMGLVGLTSYLAILGMLAIQVTRGLRSEGGGVEGDILVGLAAALSAAAAAGLLDHYYVNIVFPHMIALFWLYAGLASVAASMISDAANKKRHEGLPTGAMPGDEPSIASRELPT